MGGTDDDWDDPDTVVAEVKSNKKALNKVSDSDFETDLKDGQPERKLQRTSELRSSKRGQNTMLTSNEQVSQKRNNNFVYERGASKKIK